MIQEGHVRVVWINSNHTLASPRYTVTFACYEPPEEFGAQKPKDIVGDRVAGIFAFYQGRCGRIENRITCAARAWLRGIR
jgi:hypothetical protein